ncbi:cuticle protein 7-like [Ctenocephalides felis]|uniref:cuticle protein 7-like n=1 Tax=Ctenocephalides felis TaxID=7515 RepID=UPI000E6E3839|nr:cuticle protein 7-like [Ctenocephalides felis]
MTFLSILCSVAVAFSAVTASPQVLYQTPYIASPYLATPYVAGGHLSTQYHSQDDFGQYAYGYNNGFDSKTEHRSLDGVTRGSYSYVDPEGKLQSVHYTADAVNGFRVAATNLPEDSGSVPSAIEYTPEVAQARAEHLKAVEQAKAGYVAPISGDVPTQVEDTPEVVEARSAHLKEVEKARIDTLLAILYGNITKPYEKSYNGPALQYVPSYVTPYGTYVRGSPPPIPSTHWILALQKQ